MSFRCWITSLPDSAGPRLAILMALAGVLAGCSILPAAAPTSVELKEVSSNEAGVDYAFVRIDARVAALLNRYRSTFGARFHGPRYSGNNALHNGDVIAITVYETGGQTLFPPPAVVPGAAGLAAPLGAVATGASNIPPQVVEADGTIFVPFVGRAKVSGLTPGQAGALIERDLQGKAVSPQVLVSVVNNIGNAVTVSGEVNSARPVPLGSRGERLLDVIAAAGGAKYPAYETYVQIVRRGQVGNVLLQTIVNNPEENVTVQPRDQIYLTRNPRTFAALGATQKVATYPFATEKVTLAEAFAQAGGSIDTMGDLSGIYLFRFEPWSVAQTVVDEAYLAKFAADATPEFVPVLYQLNLKGAEGYFLSQAIQMRDKDIILVTDSTATQLTKLLALARGFSGIAYDLKRTSVTP